MNWDSFKYRNYDYTIGRFMSVDPLSEKFPFQSHYVFSANRVIDAREFEGLEAVAVNYDIRGGFGIVFIGGEGIIMDYRGNIKSYTYGGSGLVGLGFAGGVGLSYFHGTVNQFSGSSIAIGGKVAIEGIGGGINVDYSPGSNKWRFGGTGMVGYFASVGIDYSDVTIKNDVNISKIADAMPKKSAIAFLKMSIVVQSKFLAKNISDRNAAVSKLNNLQGQLKNKSLSSEDRSKIKSEISNLKDKISDLNSYIQGNIKLLGQLNSALEETYQRPDYVMDPKVFNSPIHYDIKN